MRLPARVPSGNGSLIDMGIWSHIKREALWRLKISFVPEIFHDCGVNPGVIERVLVQSGEVWDTFSAVSFVSCHVPKTASLPSNLQTQIPVTCPSYCMASFKGPREMLPSKGPWGCWHYDAAHEAVA